MLQVGNMETVIFYTTFLSMGAMYLHERMFFRLADTTSIPMGVMNLHARMFCTLAHTTSIPVGAMYLHARTFWPLAHTTSIPVGAMYLHARTFCTPAHTITEVWPRANLAVVTNNLTVIIEVMLIEDSLQFMPCGRLNISAFFKKYWKSFLKYVLYINKKPYCEM